MGYGFLKGCTIGLIYAAPIGPVAILCLRRTLTENWLSGVISGLGSATAIALYSILVVLGVDSIADLLINHHAWLRLLSGIFLCCLGARIALIQPFKAANALVKKSYSRCYSSTFILAFIMALPDLTFPVFVLNWITDVGSNGFYNPIPFSLGILISETAWWLVFCSICWKLRLRLQQKFLQWINYASGGTIVSFGIATVAKSMSLV